MGVIKAILLIISFFTVVLSVSYIYNFFTCKIKGNRFKKFLKLAGGSMFFFYNNKKNFKEFIISTIIPQLSQEIKIIHFEGHRLNRNNQSKLMMEMLNQTPNQVGFPYLIKIANNQLISISINKEIFDTLNHNEPVSELFNKINAFYLSKSILL
jgi:hypothetical protein